MTVRRLITLTDHGSRLLDAATGGSKARGGGDYLSEVLRQRQEALARALYEATKRGPSDVAAALAAWEGLDTRPMNAADAERLIRAVTRVRPDLGTMMELHLEALCVLAQEYNAGHAQVSQWLQSKGDR